MIQVSKLSGLLYNLYTNKVPIIHEIMKDPAKYGITDKLKLTMKILITMSITSWMTAIR